MESGERRLPACLARQRAGRHCHSYTKSKVRQYFLRTPSSKCSWQAATNCRLATCAPHQRSGALPVDPEKQRGQRGRRGVSLVFLRLVPVEQLPRAADREKNQDRREEAAEIEMQRAQKPHLRWDTRSNAHRRDKSWRDATELPPCLACGNPLR